MAVAFLFLTRNYGPAPALPPVPQPVEGLPTVRDYHALLVGQEDSDRVLLGAHDGVYESLDGGVTWQKTTLVGRDAMSLEWGLDSTVWVAGHEVLSVSSDGGGTWTAVRPRGLPSLDVHAFTIDAADRRNMYAAVAGEGLYRSTDGGATFARVSRVVGGDLASLALTRAGELLGADARRGLLRSVDGGRTWEVVIPTPLVGIAIHPEKPQAVLAAGPGVLLSADGGQSFQQVLDVPPGVGPVAWAPSNSDVGYAVGLDGVLYRTADAGQSWKPAA